MKHWQESARVVERAVRLGRQGQATARPVGLDLGAEGPEQVAVSVVAELLAVRSRREPIHPREREAAVHGCD